MTTRTPPSGTGSGNFQAYEENKIERLGANAARPHRVTYRKLTREVTGPPQVSVVIPVYQGERTLAAPSRNWRHRLRYGCRPVVGSTRWPVLLVHDCGPDASDDTIRHLCAEHDWARPCGGRNFGQHAATLAGIAASGGEWVATLDEDGQHDPEALGSLLDTAMDQQADVVYAKPTNEPPHGPVRNLASRGARRSSSASPRVLGPRTSTAIG